jgi:hypothetical protein
VYSKDISNIKCNGNLIIAGATNYGIRELRTFLLSYNISGSTTNSQMLLLFNNKQKEDSILMDFLTKINSIKVEYIDVGNEHIGNFRFKWILSYLNDLLIHKSIKYCNIVSTDVRDVYFQGNLFSRLDNFKNETIAKDKQNNFIYLAEGMIILYFYFIII